MWNFARIQTLAALASLLSVTACAAAPEETASSDDADLKKKVTPSGTAPLGTFELRAPAWSTAGALGALTFDAATVRIGDRVTKPEGSYSFAFLERTYDDGRTLAFAEAVNVAAGSVTARTPAGLRIRFAEPLNFSGASVDFSKGRYSNGFLTALAPWRTRADGALLLMPSGRLSLSTSASDDVQELDLAEGELKDVVLPVARVAVQFDALDVAYPTQPQCQRLAVGGGPEYENRVVERPRGANVTEPLVLPFSAKDPKVSFYAFGRIISVPLKSGETTTVALNRLEVDDLRVDVPGEPSRIARGKFTLEVLEGGAFRPFSCEFATHSGVDLPDGTYRVTSKVSVGGSVVSHVEEVSFP